LEEVGDFGGRGDGDDVDIPTEFGQAGSEGGEEEGAAAAEEVGDEEGDLEHEGMVIGNWELGNGEGDRTVLSLEALLRRSATAANYGQRVIFSTSQKKEFIEPILRGLSQTHRSGRRQR
jgi:hypothetical protein